MPITSGPATSERPQPAPADSRRGQRLQFLAVVFGVLLNFPLLTVFDHDGWVAGVPVLYLYVLLLWVLLVALTGWLAREKKQNKSLRLLTLIP